MSLNKNRLSNRQQIYRPEIIKKRKPPETKITGFSETGQPGTIPHIKNRRATLSALYKNYSYREINYKNLLNNKSA